MKNFTQLGLRTEVEKAITDLGYETPTPVQQQSIPVLLKGCNLIGQAQTGTGKTAAFALPILNQIDLEVDQPQALILAPTRELAIQVSEAFHSYAKYLKNFHVLPIYGGQEYRPQLRGLKRGVHVVVGTPGRVMDHIRKGSLKLDCLNTLVLDEADEMLKMGFIDDVKWVLEQIPHEHQTALFSATMPKSIQEIAQDYLDNPAKVKIEAQAKDVKSIKQYYTMVSQKYKLEALTRFLEAEDFSAAIIFTRTKVTSSELAEKLEARGHRAAAINGDMAQAARETVIARLKNNAIDIIVATEVAARGLDIDRIGFVINYDMAFDVESYVHRIGRTGRAGREGKALVFVTRRERRMLRDIERITKQKVEEIHPPSLTELKEKRLVDFKNQLSTVIASEDLTKSERIIESLQDDGFELADIAAACMHLSLGLNKADAEHGKNIDKIPTETMGKGVDHSDGRQSRRERQRDRGRENNRRNKNSSSDKKRDMSKKEPGMARCRMELGYNDHLTPREVVGLIANRCDIDSKLIGHINIYDDHCLVDISDQVVKKVFKTIKDQKLKRKLVNLSRV